jgi:hypothetical protein
MSAKQKPVWHALKSKSWWRGTVTSLCGVTSNNYENRWLASVTCPDCKAIQKARKGR